MNKVEKILKKADENFKDYIGIFDSGVGGLSVVQKIAEVLPNENLLYFGDSANAPYGSKTEDEIRGFTFDIADAMIASGCKALVIACNTATSVAAASLRRKYPDIPILGLEPALKPASEKLGKANVLVMATPVTLRLKKFNDLISRFMDETNFITCPCPGLAKRIERGNFEDEDLKELLAGIVGKYRGSIDGIVLGCTHYPFIKSQIREAAGDVPMFDGACGTAKELRRELLEAGLINESECKGKIALLSSCETEEEIRLYEWLLNKKIPEN